MKATEFVERIQRLKPSENDFKNADISMSFVERCINEFEIIPIREEHFGNEIMSLILNYNVEKLNINDITFDSDYQEDDEYIFFGWDALPNRIAIYKSSGKIVSYYPEGDRIDFLCAENAEKFLDALYEIMKFWKEKIINSYPEEIRDEKSISVAYIAALKAGGEEYEDYYKSVLWIE